jgi:hypothetical protein
MATLENLPQLISENPQAREELLSTLVDFCHRYGINAAPEDFIGLQGSETDTSGQVLNATPIVAQPGPVVGGQLEVFIYRDGPRRSRWIWSG